MKKIWEELCEKLGLTDSPQTDEKQLVQYATAALLLEMCEADLKVEASEVDAVCDALEKAFKMPREEINLLVEKALMEAQRKVSFHPQVEAINANCSPKEKAQIIENLWRVAYADGNLDKYEEVYVRRLADMIFVPHRVFVQTKLKVQKQLEQRAQ